MFVCALDISTQAIKMVLTASSSDVPVFLEGRCFRRRAADDVLPVLEQLRRWEEYYLEAEISLVGCAQDPWPVELQPALEAAGYSLRCISHSDVTTLQVAWRRARPVPQWLRGSLMAHWTCAASDCSGETACLAARLDSLRAVFEDRLLNIEGDLVTEHTCISHQDKKCAVNAIKSGCSCWVGGPDF